MRPSLRSLCIHIASIIFSLVPCASYADITTTSKAAILMDAASGQILYQKDADLTIPPASMSKMMTIYLIFDALKKGDIQLTDEFVISENAWRQEGSRMFTKLGDKVTVENLLRGAIIQSGNDACVALAEGLSGSVEAFVARMNETGKKIGLKNSSFANPTGLPDTNHYMTVYDLAKVGRELVYQFPEYYKIYSEKEFTWNNIKQGNRNPLLYYFQGADGIKTGHTEEAGYCLTGSATKDNMRLISVVSGLSSDRERRDESVKILGYGFAEFKNMIIDNHKDIAKLPVYLGVDNTMNVSLDKELNLLVKKSDANNITAKIQYNTPLIAPIKKGDIVGKIFITLPNQTEKITTNLIASVSMPKTDFIGRILTSARYFLFGTPQFNTQETLVKSDALLEQ
jgi:serine-type D-Ala-D-Ala carboxypeptidase (penicillin-binding protein 5/6)